MVRDADELRSMEVENEKLPEKDIYALMFEDLTHTSRKLSPLQLWNQEINTYQAMPRADYKCEPLLWWKSNIGQLPNLGRYFIILFIVLIYLSIFYLFVHSFIHLFIHLFIYSFIHSFIHSFIYSLSCLFIFVNF
jgi:hypothetical protein